MQKNLTTLTSTDLCYINGGGVITNPKLIKISVTNSGIEEGKFCMTMTEISAINSGIEEGKFCMIMSNISLTNSGNEIGK